MCNNVLGLLFFLYFYTQWAAVPTHSIEWERECHPHDIFIDLILSGISPTAIHSAKAPSGQVQMEFGAANRTHGREAAPRSGPRQGNRDRRH
jgi:hypothetical protein